MIIYFVMKPILIVLFLIRRSGETKAYTSLIASLSLQEILGLPDQRGSLGEVSINTQASWEYLAIQINQVAKINTRCCFVNHGAL